MVSEKIVNLAVVLLIWWIHFHSSELKLMQLPLCHRIAGRYMLIVGWDAHDDMRLLPGNIYSCVL